MAELPDVTSLGRPVMPQGRAVRVPFTAGVEAGEGLARTADTLNQAVQHYADTVNDFNYGRARSAMLQARAGIEKQLETDQNWQTHEQRFNDVMKTAREESGKLIASPRVRAQFDAAAEADILSGADAVRANARRMEGEWGRGELDNLLDTNRRAALESKDAALRNQLVSGSFDAINGAQAKGYINPEQATRVRQAWTEQYGEGWVDVLPTPSAQLAALRNPKGKPADFIDPAKRADMIRRLEDHMRVEGDKREAKAERAIAQYERQTASGVPPTPALRKEWEDAIRGTTHEGEFNELRAGEQEVQDTLRKPLAEQVRLVQSKREALMANGGSLSQAANVERLDRAVKQNLALINTAPLLYSEQRLNQPNDPLNLVTLDDPQAQGAMRGIFQDRAANIATMRKQLRAPVPMRPLLPQEVDMFQTLLSKAAPKDATNLFASLREATGSNDIFNGAMAQIAPDDPVTAWAGSLSNAQRELKTGSSWFTPTMVTSEDVASTILAGQRILNPSKADKSSDGKPQTKLFLPEDKTLQDRFVKVVGDVFRGRDDDAQRAYQAVKAYYVGKGSLTGRMAQNSTDIEVSDVREAVKATLGNVSNYNGNGKVLLPWGMEENDFEDRVNRAFKETAQAYGLPAHVTPTLDDFGLINGAKEGQYAITVGRKFIYDQNGNPVMIDLRLPDPHANRGVINRGGQ